jgi:hypothetical protein
MKKARVLLAELSGGHRYRLRDLIFAGEISPAGRNAAFPRSFPAFNYYRCPSALRTVRYLASKEEIEVTIA